MGCLIDVCVLECGRVLCSEEPNAKLTMAFVCNTFSDPATIENITSSKSKSWIGQTVTLKCVSDGIPTPTITWIKPDGSVLNSFISKENTISVDTTDDQDFGIYTCKADNGFGHYAKRTIQLQQISKRNVDCVRAFMCRYEHNVSKDR